MCREKFSTFGEIFTLQPKVGWSDLKVDEPYEYKNFGVLKNYVDLFSSNIDDNMDNTRKQLGMIFSSDLDNRKANPLIYVKFWRQACLSTLLYGAERFTLTPTLLLRTERCQSWFLKNSFYVAPGPLLKKLWVGTQLNLKLQSRRLCH